MDSSKCAVLVPVASHIEPETSECLSALIEAGYVVRTLRGCAQVDFARAVLATAAVDDGFEELMWIDSDITFRVADVEKLRAHNLPLTCGIYARKGMGRGFAFTPENASPMTLGKGGGLTKIKYAGMGFMHMRREVLEAVEKQFGLPRCFGSYDPSKQIVPWFMPMCVQVADEKVEYLSEDASFCERARQLNIPLFADTSLRIGHVGRHVFSWDDQVVRTAYDSVTVQVG